MAPVSDYSINAPQPLRENLKPEPEGFYRVQSGDTLYSIAWRYGKDYRGLARANKIGSNYRIFPGQLVRIAEAPPLSSDAVKTEPSSASKTSGSAEVTTKESSASPSPVSPSGAEPDKTTSVVTGPLVWRWPASGRVIQSFGSKGRENNGLNISGRRGEPVFAAAAGVVVYAGNGLLGYGNLVIINHNETFLSAYAHNNKLLVKEQDRVNVGQKIAEIGNSGVTRTMLHFEIRKEGKPVDPIRYLPPR